MPKYVNADLHPTLKELEDFLEKYQLRHHGAAPKRANGNRSVEERMLAMLEDVIRLLEDDAREDRLKEQSGSKMGP